MTPHAVPCVRTTFTVTAPGTGFPPESRVASYAVGAPSANASTPPASSSTMETVTLARRPRPAFPVGELRTTLKVWVGCTRQSLMIGIRAVSSVWPAPKLSVPTTSVPGLDASP